MVRTEELEMLKWYESDN